MKRIIFFILSLSYVWASSSIGSVAGQFLEVNLNVKNMGMGNATTSLVDGASSVIVNPAGLADYSKIGQLDTYLSYVNWPAEISFGFLGVSKNMNRFGVVSASVLYVNYGDEIRTTQEMPFGDGNFSMGGMSVGLSFSKFVTDKFSFGITMKNVSEKYDDAGYSQLAWDIGTLYRTGYKNIKIGMSILNFSKEIQFDGKYLDFSDKVKYALGDSSSYSNWPLPMTFRTGISMDAWQSDVLKATCSFDVIHSNNNDEQYGIGAECAYLEKYFLRTGYQIGTDIQGLTFGGGLVLMDNIQFDYALSTMRYFGPRHRISLRLNF